MFTTRSTSVNSNRCGTSASRSLGPISGSSLIIEKTWSMTVLNSLSDRNSAAIAQEPCAGFARATLARGDDFAFDRAAVAGLGFVCAGDFALVADMAFDWTDDFARAAGLAFDWADDFAVAGLAGRLDAFVGAGREGGHASATRPSSAPTRLVSDSIS